MARRLSLAVQKSKESGHKALPGSPQRVQPKRWVRRLLKIWQAEGLLNEDTAAKIAACYPRENYAASAIFFCFALGVCIFCMGVVWAVAAGWFAAFVPELFWVYAAWFLLALSLFFGAFMQLSRWSGNKSGKIPVLSAPILSFFLIATFYIAFERAYQLPNNINLFYNFWFWAAFPLALLHRSFLLLLLNNLVWTASRIYLWDPGNLMPLHLLLVLGANALFYGYYQVVRAQTATWGATRGFAESFCAQLTLLLVWLQLWIVLSDVADILDMTAHNYFLLLLLGLLAFAARYP